MKRKALLLLLSACFVCTVPARADIFLLGFTGFDYAVNGGSHTTYLSVGDSYHQVGFITSVGNHVCADLSSYVDMSVNEYTYYMNNFTVTNSQLFGTFLVVDFSNGRTRYYEDSRTSGTAATYGVNPPNATAPSTFTDGTIALGGPTIGLQLTYDFSNGLGDFTGQMDLDEGTDLTYICPALYSGWVLGGLSGHELLGPGNAIIPIGYDHQVTGECRRNEATPTTHTTWGALKSLYR